VECIQREATTHALGRQCEAARTIGASSKFGYYGFAVRGRYNMPASGSSRRSFIKTMCGIATAIGVPGAAAIAQEYTPQEQKKLSQAAAKYQDRPNGNDACGACPYFQFPKGCVLVEGEISPMGWCRMFTSFSPLDRGAHQ
jgi:hypothetical protein